MSTLVPITTNILRDSYTRKEFNFGNPQGNHTIVLIGSCRIVPFLNYFRVYNSQRGHPYQLLCFNPVEMWDGPGHDVSEGVNRIMAGYKFGRVDTLICEHVQYCGLLNTFRESPENIFASLGCEPKEEIRLPNWNDLHVFDAETAIHDKEGYGKKSHAERVDYLRLATQVHKARFLSHCRGSSFPELEQWVEENWLKTRLGWTSSHPSLPLLWTMFSRIAGAMRITITPEMASHPLCATDTYQSTGIALTNIDYEANGWRY